jgi:hypothetical protein
MAREAENMPPPLYEAGGMWNCLSSYEGRLVGAKVLCTRAQAEIEMERTRRNTSILFGTNTHVGMKDQRKRDSIHAREAFGNALRSQTAFSNLLDKIAQEKDVQTLIGSKDFRTSLSGAREFLQAHADWIHDGARTETYSIRDILKPQDMFLRKEVSTEEEMKVSQIGRLWNRNGKDVITETRAEVGLWKVSPDMKLWAETIGNKLDKARGEHATGTLDTRIVKDIYFYNRENVADDPMILDRVQELSKGFMPYMTIYLFTQDRKLCKAVATTSGMNVLRVSPNILLSFVGPENVEEGIMKFDMNPALANSVITPPEGVKPCVISIVDTGSLGEMLMKYESLDDIQGMAKKIVYRRESIASGRNYRGRFETLSYKPILTGSVLGLSGHMIRDERGRPAYELFRPQKRLVTRTPKFESYKDGDSLKSESQVSSGSSTRRRSRKPTPVPSENMY